MQCIVAIFSVPMYTKLQTTRMPSLIAIVDYIHVHNFFYSLYDVVAIVDSTHSRSLVTFAQELHQPNCYRPFGLDGSFQGV